MRPEGHFATGAVMSAVAYAQTGSTELAASIFVGAFAIDLDHYFDYLVFERQWSLNPIRFLNYYFEQRARYLVLVLHSYEVMALLTVLAVATGSLPLIGYLAGAAVHLTLDVIYNGYLLKAPIRHYSLLYRRAHNFESARLLKPEPHVAPATFTLYIEPHQHPSDSMLRPNGEVFH